MTPIQQSVKEIDAIATDSYWIGWKQGMTDAGDICDALIDKPESVKYEFGPAIRKARDAKAIQNNPAS